MAAGVDIISGTDNDSLEEQASEGQVFQPPYTLGAVGMLECTLNHYTLHQGSLFMQHILVTRAWLWLACHAVHGHVLYV